MGIGYVQKEVEKFPRRVRLLSLVDRVLEGPEWGHDAAQEGKARSGKLFANSKFTFSLGFQFRDRKTFTGNSSVNDTN